MTVFRNCSLTTQAFLLPFLSRAAASPEMTSESQTTKDACTLGSQSVQMKGSHKAALHTHSKSCLSTRTLACTGKIDLAELGVRRWQRVTVQFT